MSEITIKVSGDALAVLKNLADKPGMSKAIADAIDLQNQFTVADMSARKLSGPTSPTTLSVRSDRLRSSIRATPTVITATGIQTSIGSNVVYAGPLEFGVDKDVEVKEHTRTSSGTGSGVVLGRRKKIKFTGQSVVHAHSRHMKLTGRHYIESTIKERAPEYGTGVSNAIMKFLQGPQS